MDISLADGYGRGLIMRAEHQRRAGAGAGERDDSDYLHKMVPKGGPVRLCA